ncbi:hypothetical protein DFH07DRAFT_810290 [Mycena maculata]|uniref:Uncharacterized protein n=1 Tax=Mycena maculata TaxID=230809 RepID=A0AAD7JKP8_9AGAR|nr:hypothetical protein DFH07DRAFT_810290 [Mycena maculata]
MVLREWKYASTSTCEENKPKRTYTMGKARLMTSAEMAQALLDELQKKQMAELHCELKKNIFPGIKKVIVEAEKAAKEKAKVAEQAGKAAAKRADPDAKAAEKAKKAAEREAAKAAKVAARARGRGWGGARGARQRAGVLGSGGRGRGKHETVVTKKNRAQNRNLLTKKLLSMNPMSAEASTASLQPPNLRMKKPISCDSGRVRR